MSEASREDVAVGNEQDQQAYLARAGRTLLSSLDYRATLQQLAGFAVPVLADWCAVDMVREDGTFARLAVAHPLPKMVALAHELWVRYPPRPDDTAGVPHVARTGVAELVSEIPEGFSDSVTRDGL